MPAPRGRRKGGGGIRKKKDPNRQRLARVVRSGEKRDKKIARRIELLRASSSAVSQRTKTFDTGPTTERRFNDEASSGDDELSAESSDEAYSTLLSLLPQAKRATKSPKPTECVGQKRPRVVGPLLNDAGGVNGPRRDASAETPEATAAARAEAHFGVSGDAVREHRSPDMRSLGALQNVGRVSASFAGGLPEPLPNSIDSLALQPNLDSRWRSSWDADLDPLCGAFCSGLRDFRDIVLTRRVTIRQEVYLRRLYVVHAVAHVIRSKKRVARHDAALKASGGKSDPPRDQGYARPRVLLLLPMRNVAYEVVHTILALTAGEGIAEIANKERFEQEFAPEAHDEEFDENAPEALRNPAEPASAPYSRGEQKKPIDFRYAFRGNIDDDFKFGISLSRKVVKLYSDFYNSDIIVASPLGLRRNMAAKAAGYKGPGKQKKKDDNEDGDGEWKTGLSAKGSGKRDADDDDDGFLSSIEVCVLDGGHVFEMQNWETFLKTMERVSNIPVSTRDTDFSRVREWALDGLMRRFRQTVVLSAYRSAPLMGFVRSLDNHAGRMCISELSSHAGSQSSVSVSLRETFIKVENVGTPVEVPERRMEQFEKQTLPLIRTLVDAYTLIVVPSYFDFVRVRNLLVRLQEDDPFFSFVTMCEYSRPQDVARSRARFCNKQASIAVITERFHFFWRHWIRGVNTVVFYGLPQNAHFYPEFLNMTKELASDGSPAQSIALFDQFDAFPLERIVGRARCKSMMAAGSRSSFMFVS